MTRLANFMRLASFNIKHASVAGLDVVARQLASLDADLIGLQEVDRDVERSGKVDQVAALVKRLKMQGAFGRAMAVETGQYGLFALSRWPVTDNWTVPLPAKGEPRALLVAQIAHPAGPLHFAVGHLGLDEAERLEQAGVVLEALDGLARVALAADVNEGPDGPAMRALTGRLRDAWREAGAAEAVTAPPDRPQARIDVILLGEGWPRATRAEAVDGNASDHRAVVVDVGDPS